MVTEETKEQDVFQCKMYITDLETGQQSKEIDVSDLVFNDWIEFEFGNYDDEDYGTLPYKDFKFFINDYEVTFYSPLVKELKQKITNLENKYCEALQKIVDLKKEINEITCVPQNEIEVDYE